MRKSSNISFSDFKKRVLASTEFYIYLGMKSSWHNLAIVRGDTDSVLVVANPFRFILIQQGDIKIVLYNIKRIRELEGLTTAKTYEIVCKYPRKPRKIKAYLTIF